MLKGEFEKTFITVFDIFNKFMCLYGSRDSHVIKLECLHGIADMYSFINQVSKFRKLFVKNVRLRMLRRSNPKRPTFSPFQQSKIPLDTIYLITSTRSDMGASPTFTKCHIYTINLFARKNLTFLKRNRPHLL